MAQKQRTARAVAGVVLALVAGAVLGAAPDASAAVPVQQPLSVTYVARQCATYTDVMANKARNNLQESLRDLGPDSTYASGGSVTVAAEAAGSPACTPLAGWGFSTGTGITGKTPATLHLSTVTGALRSDIVTQSSVPELDAAGNATGRTLAGAVTVQLTAAEQAAATRNSLWVQGGTPAQPLNGLEEQYGFAALRCARDAVNGDNVETVVFPTGARHVFCYYYAVSPPPTAGTITIRKEIAAGSSGSGDFRFDGNISYADSDGDGTGDFTVSASDRAAGEVTFVRAAGAEPWTFTEDPGSGWTPVGPPTCTATNPEGPVTSAFAIGADQSVAVTLGALDDIVCTFTNGRSIAGALLRKETLGGVGDFTFELLGATGSPAVALVTTSEPGVPETAIDLAELPPDTYTATEVLPAPTAAGSWELDQASCNGQPLAVTSTGPLRRQATVVVSAGPLDCVATNRFTPGGSISVTKTTTGGTGTFDFLVTPEADDTTSYAGTVTTTTPGVPAPVTPDGTGAGPLVEGLVVDPGATYTVTELLPAPSDVGHWELVSADCGPSTGPLNRETASVQVTLTLAAPDPTCTFVNQLVPAGTLDVVKTTTPDTALRPGPAVLALVCGDQTFVLDVPAGAAQGAVPQQLVTGTTTCSVSETATGARDGVAVTTTAVLTVDGVPRPLVLGEPFPVGPGQAVAVAVTNALVDPVPPPSPPPPESWRPPDPVRSTGHERAGDVLADTGADDPVALGGLAGSLLAAGTALLTAARLVRQRPARRDA
jgi:hypothetical protein